jgi:hypothetical protein
MANIENRLWGYPRSSVRFPLIHSGDSQLSPKDRPPPPCSEPESLAVVSILPQASQATHQVRRIGYELFFFSSRVFLLPIQL